ncbi:MAG: hypothetical protein FWC57_03940 [Endomicrobia bacterium]|nr:hypothetical protein [Endomicrobiia bacterium]
MKNIVKKIIPLLLVFALSANSYAATGGAAFLSKGVGAKALGMGGAFTSISDDTSAVYWNPAGLARIQDYSITGMSSAGAADEWPGQKDIVPTHNFLAFSVPANKFTTILGNSVFALGYINSAMDNVIGSDDRGNQTGTFPDTQNAFYLSWGIPIWEDTTNLYAGASIKYITENMDASGGGSASGYDFDAGVIYNIFETLNFGLFLGKGAAMSWDGGDSDNAPLTTRFGVSNSFSLSENFKLLGAFDLVQVQDYPLSTNIGAELTYLVSSQGMFGLSALHLRGGVNGLALESRYEIKETINQNIAYSAGFGLDLVVFGKFLQLDYALSMGNIFDQQNKFSLNFYF